MYVYLDIILTTQAASPEAVDVAVPWNSRTCRCDGRRYTIDGLLD